MLKKTLAIAVASTLLGAYGTTFAAGHGNAGGGMGAGNAGAGISSNAGTGMGMPRTAPEAAIRNSNGTNAVDRDKGLDRAEDRANARSAVARGKVPVVNHGTARKAMTHKTAVHHPVRTRTGFHKAAMPSPVRAQTREERMEAARANWAKNRKL